MAGCRQGPPAQLSGPFTPKEHEKLTTSTTLGNVRQRLTQHRKYRAGDTRLAFPWRQLDTEIGGLFATFSRNRLMNCHLSRG
jgi:hypothetical protein